MELKNFCKQLDLKISDQCLLEPVWQKLTEGWTGELPFFLNEDFFAKHYPLCKGPFTLEELQPKVAEIIRICRANEAASLLAHIIYRGAFYITPRFELSFMPEEVSFFGKEYSGLFHFMVSLGVYPLMVKAYAECGIPERYAQASIQWLGGDMTLYSMGNDGRPGRGRSFEWLRYYVDKRLFRIGRLEYFMHGFREFMPLIYRKGDDLAVLCPDGWEFRADGQIIDPGDEIVFTSRIIEGENTITGTPIPPDGTMDFKASITLDTREWKPAVSPWQLCPSIHIPTGGRMPWEDVKASMLAAKEFFATYFHRQVPLLCCRSWILNPAWEIFLDHSNMARFRQECYAAPGPSWGPLAGMYFLFGRGDVPPDTLPAANRAQRAMQEAYKQHKLNTGVVFAFAEDLEKLGNQYYRNKYGKK